MIRIIGLAIGIIVGLTVLGGGIASLILGKEGREGWSWVAFWVGVVYIAAGGVFLSQIGIATQQSCLILILGSIIGWGVAWRRRRLFLKLNSEQRWLYLLVGLGLIVHLYTMIVRVGFPTTVSMGNLDPISYTTVADYLQTHSLWEGKEYQAFSPYLWSVGDLLHSSYRLGTPMVLSVLSAVAGVRAYELYSILLSVFFVMSYPVVFLLVKRIRKEAGRLEMLLLFGVYLLNSTLMYMLYNVFFAQFAWGGVLAMAVWATGKKGLAWVQAITVAGTALLYPEGLPFVLIPLALTGSFWGITVGIGLAPFSLVMGVRQIIRVIISSSQVTWIGWEKIRYPNILEILGLYNLNYSRELQVYLILIPVIVVVALMLWALRLSSNRKVIFIYLGVFGLAYFGTRVMGHNWFTYFRAITYSIFLYASLFVAGMGYLSKSLNMYKWMIGFIVMIIGGLVIRSGVRTAQQMYYHHHAVDKPLISLMQVPLDRAAPIATADLFLGEYSLWTRLWREYMLFEIRIITRQNWTTDKDKVLEITQVLVEKDKEEELRKTINLGDIVWENEHYSLYTIEEKTNEIGS